MPHGNGRQKASAELTVQFSQALNRLAKWRAIYAGWQLGTRPKGDPECDAVRDLQEARLLVRVEVSALTRLLIDKGVVDEPEFMAQMVIEAEEMEKMLEKRFPGIRACDDGMVLGPEAVRTMKGWKP